MAIKSFMDAPMSRWKRTVILMIGGLSAVTAGAAHAMTLSEAVQAANAEEMQKIYARATKPSDAVCEESGVPQRGISCLYYEGVFRLKLSPKFRDNPAEAEARIIRAAAIMARNGAAKPTTDSLSSLIWAGYADAFAQALKLGAPVTGRLRERDLNVCQLAYYYRKPLICEKAKEAGHRGITLLEIRQIKLLRAASDHEGPEIIASLADGADVNLPSPNGQTALYAALDPYSVTDRESAENQIRIIELLISKGAKPFPVAVGAGVDTPLNRAIRAAPGMYVKHKKDPEPLFSVVTAFLKAGADLTQRDSEGNTPLHVAAELGVPEVVSFLMRLGASPGAINKKRQTPLDLAADADVIRILREASGDGTGGRPEIRVDL